jgi:hypothetical protein
MTLNYDVTAEDFIAFNLYHFRHSPALQRQILITRITLSLLVIGLTLGLVYILDRDKQLSLFALFAAVIGGALFFLIYPRLIEPNLRKQLEKMLHEGKNDGVIGQQTLALTPEGIINGTPTGEQKIFWPAVEKVAATAEHVFIYVSALSAAIIPRRNFASESACTAFLQALQQYYREATGRELPSV